MSFSAIGDVFDRAGLRAKLRSTDLSWCRGVTVHHTAYPDLGMRPKGWTIQHMRNLADYYGNRLGWSAGPHLFIDEGEAFGLSPMDARGVHARSFNRTHIGIEVLGNYDRWQDSPQSGRGAACWTVAAWVCAEITAAIGRDAGAINFHRDDPRTNKTCPGSAIDREWFIGLVSDAKKGDDRDGPDPTERRCPECGRLIG